VPASVPLLLAVAVVCRSVCTRCVRLHHVDDDDADVDNGSTESSVHVRGLLDPACLSSGNGRQLWNVGLTTAR